MLNRRMPNGTYWWCERAEKIRPTRLKMKGMTKTNEEKNRTSRRRHRPRQSSHRLCELNPHTKRGVDAGRNDVEPTSFKDFLKLFGDKRFYRGRKKV